MDRIKIQPDIKESTCLFMYIKMTQFYAVKFGLMVTILAGIFYRRHFFSKLQYMKIVYLIRRGENYTQVVQSFFNSISKTVEV